MTPNLREEKKLWKKGYKRVVGEDEAGRGSLAGPVVAAAVIVNPKLKFKIQNLVKEIKDSKKLSSKKREGFYKILTAHPALQWGIGRVSAKVIDKINILEATKLAMKRAVMNLRDRVNLCKPDFLILDGKVKLDLPIPQKSVVKADQKIFSCAASSILAKVTRDRIMERYHKKYPQYGFNRHKGYPTKFHYQMLKKYGPCQIHRMSYNLKYGSPKTEKNKITITGFPPTPLLFKTLGFE